MVKLGKNITIFIVLGNVVSKKHHNRTNVEVFYQMTYTSFDGRLDRQNML
jgi:hypothetical protein